jgi:GTP-dependent phosphoenolpyruvate carboxykinase
MDSLPTLEQQGLLFRHRPHRPADLGLRHVFRPEQHGRPAGPQQIDLGLPVTENMDMGRTVIVHEDDDLQSVGTKYGNNGEFNLS